MYTKEVIECLCVQVREEVLSLGLQKIPFPIIRIHLDLIMISDPSSILPLVSSNKESKQSIQGFQEGL